MSQDQHDSFATGLQSTTTPFAAELLLEAGRIIVTPRGQLDLDGTSILALTLAKAIADGRDGVVVDLEGLDSIDLNDVGLLIRARSLLKSRGQHLVVRSPRSDAVVLAACTLLDPHARVEDIERDEPGVFSLNGSHNSERRFASWMRPSAWFGARFTTVTESAIANAPETDTRRV